MQLRLCALERVTIAGQTEWSWIISSCKEKYRNISVQVWGVLHLAIGQSDHGEQEKAWDPGGGAAISQGRLRGREEQLFRLLVTTSK